MIAIKRIVRHGCDFRAKFGFGVNSVEQVPKSPIPPLAPLPLHGDAGEISDLDPDAARAGLVGAIDLLRFDALSAKPARMGEHAPPSGALARNTGLIFVSFGTVDHLVVIDPSINKVVKNLKTSRGPRDMRFSADHSKLYVACRDDDVINVIDVATVKVFAKHDTNLPAPSD